MKRWRRKKARPARAARSDFLPPRHVLDAAEQGAALDFYEGITEGGAVSELEAVRRFPWRSSRFERQALTAARCLELLPKTRFETDPAVRPVWAVASRLRCSRISHRSLRKRAGALRVPVNVGGGLQIDRSARVGLATAQLYNDTEAFSRGVAIRT